ncbi:MAG: hypothetical protein R3E62_05465 [Pseudomonadales bacterium]
MFIKGVNSRRVIEKNVRVEHINFTHQIFSPFFKSDETLSQLIFVMTCNLPGVTHWFRLSPKIVNTGDDNFAKQQAQHGYAKTKQAPQADIEEKNELVKGVGQFIAGFGGRQF